MLRTLVLFAHPALEKSRANKILFDRLSSRADLTFHDLYEVYPDLQIDPKAEQELLQQHDLVVFMHPFYWYSSPAILKKWQDVVLEYGYAYGHHGNKLAGKLWLSSITTGGPIEEYSPEGYNHYSIRELMRPFEQTARLCHMKFLPPHVISGVNRQTVDQLSQAVAGFEERLDLLRQKKNIPDQILQLSYLSDWHPSPTLREV